MADYAVEVAGDTFRPVPESWLDHPHSVDRRPESSVRLYAVSVAQRSPRCLVVRYAQPRTNNVLQYTCGAATGPDGGPVPSNLLETGRSWARSLPPADEPQGVLRVQEIGHFRDLWSDRVAAIRSDADLIADGGYPAHADVVGQTGEERLITEFSSRPYTGHRHRRTAVEHRILANWYPHVGADVRHEIRCEDLDIPDWSHAEIWELREHGIEKIVTDVGRRLA